MNFKIIKNILENFPQNQYYLWKVNYFDEKLKFNLVKDLLNRMYLNNFSFIDKEDINFSDNNIYPIINLSWILSDDTNIFSDELISLINKGVKVVFLNVNEPYYYDDIKNFVNYCKKNKIEERNIHFLVNNKKLKNWLNDLNSKINAYFPYYQSIEHSNIFQKNKITFQEKDKKFKFMCHNNKIHIHRLATLILLHHFEILKDTDYSCIQKIDYDHESNLSFNFLDEFEKFKKSIDFILKQIPKKSFYETRFIPSEVDSPLIETKTFEESYCNIVTETHYLDNVVHITEKSLKPFYYYQFPIIIASHGHVNELRNIYGFDLFDDIIDHSYDNEKDNKKRFELIFNEIKKLQKIITPELYNKNKKRFMKNHKLICDIINIREDRDYIKKLFI